MYMFFISKFESFSCLKDILLFLHHFFNKSMLIFYDTKCFYNNTILKLFKRYIIIFLPLAHQKLTNNFMIQNVFTIIQSVKLELQLSYNLRGHNPVLVHWSFIWHEYRWQTDLIYKNKISRDFISKSWMACDMNLIDIHLLGFNIVIRWEKKHGINFFLQILNTRCLGLIASFIKVKN